MTLTTQQKKISQDKAKIIIVDDHPIIRQGLAELINHEKDLVVCGEAEDAPEAMDAIKKLNPDLIIVDIYDINLTSLNSYIFKSSLTNKSNY